MPNCRRYYKATVTLEQGAEIVFLHPAAAISRTGSINSNLFRPSRATTCIQLQVEQVYVSIYKVWSLPRIVYIAKRRRHVNHARPRDLR